MTVKEENPSSIERHRTSIDNGHRLMSNSLTTFVFTRQDIHR
jgi:hypothetical protein